MTPSCAARAVGSLIVRYELMVIGGTVPEKVSDIMPAAGPSLRLAEEASGLIASVPADRPGHPDHDERIREIAVEIAEARYVLYLGRGSAFPLALEGALKLKGNLIHPRRRLCRRRDEAR